MKKVKISKKLNRSTPKMKWQKGDYARNARFKFILPYPFLLLCRLMEVTPEEVLSDFMDNLSCGSWRREGRDRAKEHLIQYFISHGYGQHHFREEEIGEIFKEMDAVGLLFPTKAKPNLLDLYSDWRDEHFKWWFHKRFQQPRRLKGNVQGNERS